MRRLSIALVFLVVSALTQAGVPSAFAADNLTTCTEAVDSAVSPVSNGATCGVTVASSTQAILFAVTGSWGVVTTNFGAGTGTLGFSLATDSVAYVDFSTTVKTAFCEQQYGIGVDSTTAPTVTQDIAGNFAVTPVTLTAMVPLTAGSHSIYLLGQALSCGADIADGAWNGSGLSFSVTVFSNTQSTTAVSTIHFTAARTRGHLRFQWRVTAEPGIAGFNIIAGHKKLTSHPIGVHKSASYAHTSTWSGTGPYFLQVLRTNGAALLVPSTGNR
jgi:hypothetical protein